MQRDEAIQHLTAYRPSAAALGVRSLYLFGSLVREEAGVDSDVDIFIDYDIDRFGLIELARLRRELTGLLGRPADVGTRDGLIRCCATRSSERRCASSDMASSHLPRLPQ
jgi:predicted nucleotidyltransferase